MKINDDTVKAFHAAQDLRDLYVVYQASSQAHLKVLAKLRDNIKEDPNAPDTMSQKHLVLQSREHLARENIGVFAARAAQLTRRLHELTDIPEAK